MLEAAGETRLRSGDGMYRADNDPTRLGLEVSALTGFFSVGYAVDGLTGAFLAAAVAWLTSRRLDL